jgi:hypothetical protein
MVVMKRSWWISLFVLLLLLGGLGGAGYGVLSHQPAFYLDALVPVGQAREKASRDFEQSIINLGTDATYSREWKFSCTTEQINSYFVEDFIKKQQSKLLPAHVHDLRLQFEKDEILLGFQYGKGELKSVISLHLKVWLAQRDPNTLVIEVISLKAGAMPIAIKAFHEEIAEQLRSQNIKALWYRKDGHPTLVMKFQADRREASFHFKHLEISQGRFYLEGETLDPEAPSSTKPVVTQK